ncbi:FG-GAP-like repeat-containing protein [Ruegeria marina]|uniref:Hemolysin-type calcium-binding repeat-containing protein n=1 Tax=Ruegeria marina TaxID=639004 RepID=A0A1G6WRI8_9RHOB|nr:FG-GAP-like repeat-containing protein [Ruegeria marina]SDD68409.1 Hemolysin-type calcium-binding repeat-containing protein [Ruegeria marina]
MFTYSTDIYLNFDIGYVGWAQAADLNRNGLPEIVLTRFTVPGGEWQDLPILEIGFDGTLTNIAGQIGGSALPQVDFGRGLIVDDLNGDGWDDIFVADHGLDVHPFPGQVNTVLMSDGQGGWVDRSAEYSRGTDFTHSIASGDLNGDGVTDVFVGNLGVDPAYIVSVNPDGTPSFDALPLHGVRTYTTSAIADLDGDDIDELILGADQNIAPGLSSQIARWNGFGFAMTQLPAQTTLDQSIALDIQVTDLNGDDRPDIVMLLTDADPFYTRVAIQVLIQQPDGQFSDRTTDWFDPHDFVGANDPNGWGSRLFFSDLDLDGDLDLLVQMQFPNSHRIFYQEGGRFSPGSDDQTIGGSNEALALVDFDNDGVEEILAFTSQSVWVYDNGLSLPPIERIGTNGNDTIMGSGRTELIWGLGGNDSISGLGGDDTLYGGPGADTLDGGDGNDLLGGTTENDLLLGGAGNDEAYGAAGDDTIWGGAGDDVLGGSGGNDEIHGDDGNDGLWGSFGDDTIEGGAGSDTLGGSTGNDSLSGGGDADELWGAIGADTLDGGAGNDTLGGADGADSLSGGAGDDELWGADDNDTLDGGDGNDQIGAGQGNDVLNGGFGNDQLFGGLGNDQIEGGDGNDTIYGAAGDDTIDGGWGDDRIFAGPGSDVIRFSDGSDIVYYFSAGSDRIDLSGVPGIVDFANLQQNQLSEFGGSAIITDLFGNTLTLDGVSVASLTEADFIIF